MTLLNGTIASIRPVDHSLAKSIQAHLDNLTKPRGSLGRLEELAMRYCLARGTAKPVIGKKRIVCFAGDHGVAAEGVSAFPSEVTPQMVLNMTHGGAAVNALARHAGSELSVVDIGVNANLDGTPGLLMKKIRKGTASIMRGPAMTVDEARRAVEVGIELASSAAKDGVTLLGTGDMGIANTTSSSALYAALLKCPVKDVTGRGTGVDDKGLQRKIEVINEALEVNKARLTDPLNTLAALGGLEIAGICGLILGAAARRVPVAVDGFISTAGALVAAAMCPAARDYMFFSHLSQESGHKVFMKSFGEKPILDLDMRLGEGTGSALAMTLIEASIRVYNEMATFSSAGVSDKEK